MSKNTNKELSNTVKQDIFIDLNAQQLKASTSESGNILVLAGAGTGKTSTIVARVVHLLTNQKIEPKDIVLLTFTSKASIEMKERLKKYVCDDIVDGISVSTFHALCLGIIRKHYPMKKLITEKESLNLLETTYSRVIKFILGNRKHMFPIICYFFSFLCYNYSLSIYKDLHAKISKRNII